MANPIVYSEHGEWSRVTIKATRLGWLVETFSMIQGSGTGGRILYYYSDRIPKGTDLNGKWNEHTTIGQAIADGYSGLGWRVLRYAHKVF